MDEIKKIFGKENAVDPAFLSFNSKGGCPICGGTGRITFDMAFAKPVTVVCEECGGHRYNRKALSYKYKGLNIEEVMGLTIEEAHSFFDNAKIRKLLHSMLEVGLGYMTLGQPTSTLSGGEIVFSGTPETLLNAQTKTTRFLRELNK